MNANFDRFDPTPALSGVRAAARAIAAQVRAGKRNADGYPSGTTHRQAAEAACWQELGCPEPVLEGENGLERTEGQVAWMAQVERGVRDAYQDQELTHWLCESETSIVGVTGHSAARLVTRGEACAAAPDSPCFQGWGAGPEVCGLRLARPLSWANMSRRTTWAFAHDGTKVSITESFDGRGATEASSERTWEASASDLWRLAVDGDGPAADEVRAALLRRGKET